MASRLIQSPKAAMNRRTPKRSLCQKRRQPLFDQVRPVIGLAKLIPFQKAGELLRTAVEMPADPAFRDRRAGVVSVGSPGEPVPHGLALRLVENDADEDQRPVLLGGPEADVAVAQRERRDQFVV